MNSHVSRQAATVLMGAITVVGLGIPASAQRQTPAPLVVRCAVPSSIRTAVRCRRT
jgi:hypothetical protein